MSIQISAALGEKLLKFIEPHIVREDEPLQFATVLSCSDSSIQLLEILDEFPGGPEDELIVRSHEFDCDGLGGPNRILDLLVGSAAQVLNSCKHDPAFQAAFFNSQLLWKDTSSQKIKNLIEKCIALWPTIAPAFSKPLFESFSSLPLIDDRFVIDLTLGSRRKNEMLKALNPDTQKFFVICCQNKFTYGDLDNHLDFFKRNGSKLIKMCSSAEEAYQLCTKLNAVLKESS